MFGASSKLLTGAVACTALAFCGVSQTLAQESAAVAREFVRVEGSQFFVGDAPFYFVGANVHVMHGPLAREKMPQTLAEAAKDGLRVVRLWALGEDMPDAPDWQKKDYLFRAGPNGWQESAYLHLDKVLAEAAANDLRVVITLSNQWRDYGGVPMYLRWAGYASSPPRYGYRDLFFTDLKVREWFFEHVKRIVTRVNTVTGVAYRDDPTIMTWELQNELRGTPEAAKARRQWFADIARRIRKLDPNHLIVPGTIGYDYGRERDDWIEMNMLPDVSYCDQHIYPFNEARSRTLPLLRAYIDDRVQLAHHVVKKPIVFGEFGFPGPGYKDDARGRWHRRFLQRVFYDGGNGAMVWIYQPRQHWRRRFGVLVDEPRDKAVRRAMARTARQIARLGVQPKNQSIGPNQGRRSLAPTHITEQGIAHAHDNWQKTADGSRLKIAVDKFYQARFEVSGTWDGGVLVHFYGKRTGWVDYRFAGPKTTPKRLELRVRLSSEFPGSIAPPSGYSRVTVQIDTDIVGRYRVEPDDGVGKWLVVKVDNPEILDRLRGGIHLLRFTVLPGRLANGVTIYGREAPLNRDPVEDPGPLQLRVWSADGGKAG